MVIYKYVHYPSAIFRAFAYKYRVPILIVTQFFNYVFTLVTYILSEQDTPLFKKIVFSVAFH